MQQELECYENIFKDITRSKLELIGEILSGNHQREPQRNGLQEESLILGGDIATIFNQLIQEEQDTISKIRQGLMNQINLINSKKDEEYWYAQAVNQDHEILVAGRSKDLLIIEINSSEQINIHNGHADIIYAIVIYQSGEMIASGGSGNDSSIKLWTKQANQWSCIQTINDHNGCITDLQLSKNQEYLFSASEDETIKIWKMKSSNNQLECIQTLQDHNNCVLWITISQDSLFMASSNYENYFNIYQNEQNQIDPWKKLSKIDTKGKIHRLYFTKNDELLVQQENPPLLIVYEKNQNNQYLATQDVLLNEPDNNDLLFPIFQLDSTVYLKNNKFVYIIRRLKTGKYIVQQILATWCTSGCGSRDGGLILWNNVNKSIDIYE